LINIDEIKNFSLDEESRNAGGISLAIKKK
jgi:hypothetical protein